jgi:hypothetical protein
MACGTPSHGRLFTTISARLGFSPSEQINTGVLTEFY